MTLLNIALIVTLALVSYALMDGFQVGGYLWSNPRARLAMLSQTLFAAVLVAGVISGEDGSRWFAMIVGWGAGAVVGGFVAIIRSGRTEQAGEREAPEPRARSL